MRDVTLTAEEAKILAETIETMSGGDPDLVFGWDESDDPDDPILRAHAKLFLAAGEEGWVPRVFHDALGGESS